MILRPPALLILLAPLGAGCGTMFLEPLNDSGAPEEGLHIADIDPHYGPTAGGNEVTITGGGFEGTVVVRFGNAAADITVLDAGTISAIAPEAGMELTVDVSVTSSLGEVVDEGGYTFTDGEPPPDTDDTGSASGVGGLVQFSHLQVACTQCFDPPAAGVEVSALAAFHQATSSTWTDWLPANGSCAVNPSNTAPTSSFLDVGSNVHLTAGTSSITLTRTTVGGQVQYDAGPLNDGNFQRNTAYDLEAADGGSWGPFTVVDAVTTGQMITSIQPVELIYTDPREAFAPALSRSGSTISYSPYGGSGSFVLALDVYNAQGTSWLGSVVCRDYDNGSISIPASALSSFPANALSVVGMYRYGITWTPNPASGSNIEAVVSIGVLGTATIR
jgi:hypothetical protein